MTIRDSEKPGASVSPSQPPGGDDEIDLSQYFNVLINWWREIVFLTLLAAFAAGGALYGLRQLQIPQYQSSSDVVMARIVSIATLDERLQTFSNENSTSGTSSSTRRSALIGLANSGAIAKAVIAELGDILSADEQNPANLLLRVEAEALPSSDARTQSDLIRISATADDPEKAAAIANAWSRHYVEQINDLFGQIPVEIIDAIESEKAQSFQVYQSAQRGLEAFISVEHSNDLTRQIAEKQAQLDSLQSGREAALTTIIDRELGARLNLFANLVDAQVSSAEAVLVEQIEGRLDELSQFHAARSRAALLAEQARALGAQIEAGGDAATATNALALQLLKVQAFSAEATTEQVAFDPVLNPDRAGSVSQSRQTTFTLPADLQLTFQSGDVSGQDAEAQAADVDAMVEALESYMSRLDQQIAALSDDLLTGSGLAYLDELDIAQGIAAPITKEAASAGTESPEGADETLQAAIRRSYDQLFAVGGLVTASQYPESTQSDDALTANIQQLDREIQMLQAQLEAETAKSQELTQQRDLAWNSYDMLSNKVAELTLERTAANSEVRLGSPAIPPTHPVPGPRLSLAVLLGGSLGFIFGVFVAYLATYLGYQPFFSRQRPMSA